MDQRALDPKEVDELLATMGRKIPGGFDFFLKMMNYLKARGFSQCDAGRIIKVAGPGQVEEAFDWTAMTRMRLEWSVSSGSARDAIDMILSGLGGSTGFGKDRTVEALRILDLPIDGLGNMTSHRLFRVLRGAKEINLLWR